MTIAPKLLEELKNSSAEVPKRLDADEGMAHSSSSSLNGAHTAVAAKRAQPLEKVSYVDDESKFRWELLQEQMAFDKLHEGIRKFAEDGATLKSLLRKKLAA